MEEDSIVSSSWLQYFKEMKEFFGNSNQEEQRPENIFINEEKEHIDEQRLNVILIIF